MKARTAPHGNKDKEKHTVKGDSAVCPTLGIRTPLSTANMFKWTLVKFDVKSVFLQTGIAERDVYFVPSLECRNRSFYSF